jgi:thymidylate kinase
MNKIIIFEGPDGVGKSTQIDMLMRDRRPHLLVQPNPDSSMSFRDAVFNSNDLTPLEAQLMFCLSHMYDLYEYLNRFSGTLIMDRCYISGLVYGLVGDRNKYLPLVISKMQDLHQRYLSSTDVRIIFMMPKARFNEPDTDVFEKNLKWESIREGYEGVLDALSEVSASSIMSSREKIMLLDNSNLTPEETHARIREFVGY